MPSPSAALVAANDIRRAVPTVSQQCAAGGSVRGKTERTAGPSSLRSAHRLSTDRTVGTLSTSSPSSRPASSSSGAALITAVDAAPIITTLRAAATDVVAVSSSAYPACRPAAGDVPSISRITNSHSFRSPPRATAANPQRLDCSPAFRGLTPRKGVAMEHAADVAWLDSGVKGKGWGVEEKRQQETIATPAARKRGSGSIRTTMRSTPAAVSSTAALYASAVPSQTSSLNASVSQSRAAALLQSSAPRSTGPSVEPAAFLSLIKSDPTRAFQLIFPDYDSDDEQQQQQQPTDVMAHTASHRRGRHGEEEKEETEDAVAQSLSPQPLSPYSPEWKYQHTAAFDVQRPDTAGERKQTTDDMKMQWKEKARDRDDELEEKEEESGEDEAVGAQPHLADAWTRDAVQRIVSQASQSWDKAPTATSHVAEEEDEQDAEVDDSTTDRPRQDIESAYSKDQMEEEDEHWVADDEDEEQSQENNAIEAVTVSPPSPSSPQPTVSRSPPAFDRKRPSPVSTHFLHPEKPNAASVSSPPSESPAQSPSIAAADNDPLSSQCSPSSFTIAPSTPVSPVSTASQNDRSTKGSGRTKQTVEGNEDNLFEL